MGSTNKATLTNSNVNSGNAVDLIALNIVYGWKSFVKAPPVEGKFDITEVDYGGFENPIITISGVMDVQLSTIGSGTLTTISQKLLVDFANSATALTLEVKAGTNTPTTRLGGRPSGGYVTNGSNTLTNTITCRVEGFTINISTQESVGARKWNYSVTLRESNE